MAKAAIPSGYEEVFYQELLAFGSDTHDFSFRELYTLKPNTKYTFKTFATLTSGTATNFHARMYDLNTDTQLITQTLDVSADRQSFSFQTPDDGLGYELLLYSGLMGETAGNWFEFSEIQLFEAKYDEEKIVAAIKTDWTTEDYYNYDDLNRVEVATEIVKDRISAFRGLTIALEAQTSDRTETSIEFAPSLNRIERNILKLKDLFASQDHFRESKTDWVYNNPFNFDDANRLEQDLNEMYRIIEKNESNVAYCGRYTTGQEGVY